MHRFALAAAFLLFAGCDQARQPAEGPFVRTVGSATLTGTPDVFTATATAPDGALISTLAEGTSMAHLYFDELRLQPGQPFAASLIGEDGRPNATLTSRALDTGGHQVGFRLDDRSVEAASALVVGTDGSRTHTPLDVELCGRAEGCGIAAIAEGPDSYHYERVCTSSGCETTIVVDYHLQAGGAHALRRAGDAASAVADEGIRELGVVLNTQTGRVSDVGAFRLSGYASLNVYKTERR